MISFFVIIVLTLILENVFSEQHECELKRFGTTYGGWRLPIDINLNSNSIVFSAGVGEDISFDLLIQETYSCNIILIDPTERSLTHYKEIKRYYNNNHTGSFSAHLKKDYEELLINSNPNLNNIVYINKGLWHKKDELKFYKPKNHEYVSHTLIENMYSADYNIVEVDSIKNIMTELGYGNINLLKLDIEGSENIVLEQMLIDEIYPEYICVEFDLVKQNIDYNETSRHIIHKLNEHGYVMIDNDNENCLFELIS